MFSLQTLIITFCVAIISLSLKAQTDKQSECIQDARKEFRYCNRNSRPWKVPDFVSAVLECHQQYETKIETCKTIVPDQCIIDCQNNLNVATNECNENFNISICEDDEECIITTNEQNEACAADATRTFDRCQLACKE